MRKSPKLSPERMARAVRMVFDAKDPYPSQWAAVESIAGKIGCTGETHRSVAPRTRVPVPCNLGRQRSPAMSARLAPLRIAGARRQLPDATALQG